MLALLLMIAALVFAAHVAAKCCRYMWQLVWLSMLLLLLLLLSVIACFKGLI